MSYLWSPPTLCQRCGHCKTVVSGTGSRFFLCRLSLADRRYAKYPPQPVLRCQGFSERAPDSAVAGDDAAAGDE